ncbi:MAG: hypothetical protein LCH54_05985 [Bacteroidetes bacterium]|nr:hypothetical protein [Bacteroidota bacterium]
MTDIPDYTKYTISELFEAVGSIDKNKYPDRYSAILDEFQKREQLKSSKPRFRNNYNGKYLSSPFTPISKYMNLFPILCLFFIPFDQGFPYFIFVPFWGSLTIYFLYIFIKTSEVIYKNDCLHVTNIQGTFIVPLNSIVKVSTFGFHYSTPIFVKYKLNNQVNSFYFNSNYNYKKLTSKQHPIYILLNANQQKNNI